MNWAFIGFASTLVILYAMESMRKVHKSDQQPSLHGIPCRLGCWPGVCSYIHYCNARRVQRTLGILMPMEKHERYLAA